jgi:Family of unknown function (DUF6225)
MDIPRSKVRDAPVRRITVRERRRSQWTVGQLRAALSCLPDDTPLVAQVATRHEGLAEKQIVTGVDFDWAHPGGRSEDSALLFAIQCEWPVRSPGLSRQSPSHAARHGR